MVVFACSLFGYNEPCFSPPSLEMNKGQQTNKKQGRVDNLSAYLSAQKKTNKLAVVHRVVSCTHVFFLAKTMAGRRERLNDLIALNGGRHNGHLLTPITL
jgi:hypothetical protein